MNSSTKPEGFSFDTEFSKDGTVVAEGKARRYRQDEVDVLCEAAFQKGLASVEAETQRQIAASVEAIAAHLAPVMPFAVKTLEDARKQAADLAMLMTKKVAGAALDHVPAEAVMASLSETVSHLPDNCKLVLSVHPDVSKSVEDALVEILPTDMKVTIEDDPNAPVGAWDVRWSKGGFSHNPDEITKRLESLLESHLNQPIDEEQGDLFANIA